jgi:hypothetical protein
LAGGRLAQAVNGGSLVARLVGDPPKLKERAGMPRIAREHLSNELSGLRDLAAFDACGSLGQKGGGDRPCVAGLLAGCVPGPGTHEPKPILSRLATLLE